MPRMRPKTGRGCFFALALVAGAFFLPGCCGSGGHMMNEAGEPQPYLDPLWDVVNSAFPGALPDEVTIRLIDKPRSSFDEKKNTISISQSYGPMVSRGKVCLGLTHLALHALSGGDTGEPGRCFDNDVRFLEYAVASYMDRVGGGGLERELPDAYSVAARLFREGELAPSLIRNWQAFVCRGQWADQFGEWNLDGMQSMLTLGYYLVHVRQWQLEDLGGVFERLRDKSVPLESAFMAELGVDLAGVLQEWKGHVLERAAPAGIVDENEEGT
jgi:hypothetical protein